jgi:hypothetical protein
MQLYVKTEKKTLDSRKENIEIDNLLNEILCECPVSFIYLKMRNLACTFLKIDEKFANTCKL